MLTRHRRRDERGQTLVLALAFLAVFALLSMAVLQLAKAVDSQRVSTENTAATDSVVEGSAQLALADSNASNCSTVSGGSLTFPSAIRADTLQYSVPSGSTGCGTSSTGGSEPGSRCQLCLLNTPNPNAGTVVLDTGPHGNISVNGEIDANGSITGSTVTATGSNKKIGIYKYGSGGTCSSCSPTPTNLPTAFTDPLAGTLPAPSSSTPQTCCSGIINPGVYTGINLTGTALMNSGVYMVTGGINISGQGELQSNADASGGQETDSNSGGTTDSNSGGLHDSGSGGATDTGVAGGIDSGKSTAGSTTTLSDTSKNWTVNQWAGATVTVAKNGNNQTSATVASNTKTVLTISGTWSNGTPAANKAYSVDLVGFTTNTLTDSSKTWTANQWQNALVTVGGVTGYVSSNTTHTLTMTANWSTQPPDGSAYSIAILGYTATTLTDAAKTWTANQWQNALVTVGGVTNHVASNTTHTLTMSSSWSTTPSAGSAFTLTGLYYTANTLVDVSKGWTTNQWAGAQVTVTLSNNSTETDTVKSNTANSITVNTNWVTTPAVGNAYSLATLWYGANTLTDTGKSWNTGEWVNALVNVTLSNNSIETMTVASNTATTLTLTAPWTTVPVAGNAYTLTGLYYTSTTVTDVQKGWTTNEWAGSLVTVTLSNNSTETDTVAANTATTLTMTTPWTTTPAAGSQYTVVAQVVIYLACPTAGPYWTCTNTGGAGESGGYISVTGQGGLSITPPSSGSYAGIAVFADPNLIDSNSGCGSSVICTAGNGGGITTGTIYAPRGDVDIQGGGSSGTGLEITGRLVVQSLMISGNSNAQLGFTGPFTTTLAACSFFNDMLSGIEGGVAGTQVGYVRFETDCAAAGLKGQGGTSGSTVISFSYGP